MNTQNTMPTASNAERWTNCPASFKLEQGYPEITSPEAERGTMLHECMATGKNPIGADECEAVDEARTLTEEIIEQWRDIEDTSFVGLMEKRHFMSYLKNNVISGKPDAVYFSDERALIIDYKFGKGFVKCENNPQLWVLAQLVYANYPVIEQVDTVIIQPGFEPKVMQVQRNIAQLRDMVLACYEENPPLKCGDWCQYCKHLENCEKARGELISLQGVDTPLLPAKQYLASVGVPELCQLLNACAVSENVVPLIYAEALRRLETGAEVPGYVLPKPQTRKSFNEPRKVFDAFADFPSGDVQNCFKPVIADLIEMVKAGGVKPKEAKELVENRLDGLYEEVETKPSKPKRV